MYFKKHAALLRSRKVLASVFSAALISTTLPAAAIVPGGSPGPGTTPNPPPTTGPSLPYISGRSAGPRQAATTPPAGGVVPDDFCLPGKLNDCGAHLRDQPNFSADAEPETVFFGNPDLAFAEARNSFWVDAQSRRTTFSATGEAYDAQSFSLGADRRIGDRFVLGVVVTSTNSTTTFAGPGIEDQARGIQAGPYFALDLSENWVLDVRLLTGTMDHTVLTGGVLTANYSGVESFGALRLSGEVQRNNWRLHPSLEIATMLRDDNAYIDGIRGPVAASSSSETFFTGALLAYYEGFSGALTPYVGFEATAPTNGGNPFGTLRTGLSSVFDNGAMLNFNYSEGALGLANVSDRLFSISFEIPF